MFKKVARPKIAKKKRKKGHALAQAFAAAIKRKRYIESTSPQPWANDDFIPMEHFRNGRPRPLASQCTCKRAPTKYCWVHKGYAQPQRDELDQRPIDLWASVENGT